MSAEETSAPTVPRIELRCPTCGKTFLAIKWPGEPEDAVAVVIECQDCETPGTFESLTYLDAAGKEVE